MVRTIVSLPKEDKAWVDKFSRARRQPSAETIRRAIRSYRKSVERGGSGGDALRVTAGIWKGRVSDALRHVRRLRSEWDRSL
ncbi:MAG: ribbon-helix-helix protein, CopG family [Elusimicrobiota bacterium]|jgi:hypothetical protein